MTKQELIKLLSDFHDDDQIIVEHTVQTGDSKKVLAYTTEPKINAGWMKDKPTIWICIEEDHANE